MKGLRDLFRRRAELADLKAEIRAHLDEKVASLVAAGMPRAEAEQAARRAFGNVTNVEEAGRDVWRMPRVDDLVADVGFAFRFMRRSPAFAAVAVSSLALGIGANLAVFTVINALLLRPLPVDHPGALVVFSRQDADTGRTNSLTFREYADLRARTSSFVGLLAHSGGDGSLRSARRLCSTPANAFATRGCRATSLMSSASGWRPGAGSFPSTTRRPTPSDRSSSATTSGSAASAATPPSSAGRVIVFRDVPFTVVGVAARGFRGIEADERTDAWWPVGTVKIMFADRLAGWNVTVMGRLKPGVPLAQARADAQVAHAAIVIDEAAASPGWNDARRRRFLTQRFDVSSGRTGIAEALRAGFTQPLYALMASVAAVLAHRVRQRRRAPSRAHHGSTTGAGGAAGARQRTRQDCPAARDRERAPHRHRDDGRRRARAARAPDDLELRACGGRRRARHRTRSADAGVRRRHSVHDGAHRRAPARDSIHARARGRARRRSARQRRHAPPRSRASVAARLAGRTIGGAAWLSPGCSSAHSRICVGSTPASTARPSCSSPSTAARRRRRSRARSGRHSNRFQACSPATFYANLGLLGGGSAMSDCIIDGTLPGASAEVTCAMMQVGPRFFEATSTPIVAGRAFATGDEPPAAQVAIINETMARQYIRQHEPARPTHPGEARRRRGARHELTRACASRRRA